MADIRKALESICGVDENNQPNAIMGAYLHKVDNEGNILQTLENCSFCKPIIKLYPRDEVVQIDICFQNENDSDLNKLDKMLQRGIELESEKNLLITEGKEVNEHYVLLFNFLPATAPYDYAIEAIRPVMHAITAEEARKEVSCLRVLFWSENVSIYEIENNDFSDLDMEVEMEIRQREDAEERAQLAREEAEAHQKELEEYRKTHN